MSRVTLVTGRKLPRSTRIGLLVEHIRGLDDFAVGREHGGIGEAVLHQLQAHQAIVHVLEGRAGELDHVHFDALAGQVVEQRRDERLGIVREGRWRRGPGSRP